MNDYSFFSAPHLKRDPLGSHYLVPSFLRTLLFRYYRWRGNAFAQFGPYTLQHWQEDGVFQGLGGALDCPDCGSAADFGPRKAQRSDGSTRLYRGCKTCGFWQEADGWSLAYRCWFAGHMCNTLFNQDRECGGCGNVIRAGTTCHTCRRVLTPNEMFTCPECQVLINERFMLPWPVSR